MKQRLRPLAVLAIPIIHLVICCGACTGLFDRHEISNGLVAAVVDQRLVSFRDLSNGSVHRFAEDGFSLIIDGKEYRSSELQAGEVKKGPSSYEVSYSAEPFQIRVRYELMPGRRFISKQILVSRSEGGAFSVEKVVPLACGIEGEEPESRFVPTTYYPQYGPKDYGLFLRFPGERGLFALVQNPFLEVQSEGGDFSIGYEPQIDWDTDFGPFEADRACIGACALGQRIPARMVGEWTYIPDGRAFKAEDGMRLGEVRAFTECVRAFILGVPEKSVKIHIGWCENDYQIDISEPEGRVEYKRIIDSAAAVGCDYVLFAPTNDEISSRAESHDDWSWENLLWLGLGQKIRKGEWDPKRDEVPASVREMLDYAAGKGVKLVAYVYPVMPFAGNPDWIVRGRRYRPGNDKPYAALSHRGFQDWLIENLTAFYRRTGIGGYAFDYTFFWYDGSSDYAQWKGWCRVMEALRRRYPEIVMDGRQIYQRFGPWGWLAGSYPHPSSTDEQPESFAPFPDLHFDRVSAHRQRFAAFWYRNYEFCPNELMPGYMTHQTPRSDADGVMRLDRFNARDWDYLGWKYSVISSIATAGLNNVVDMLPARDQAEFENFSEADRAWLRGWLEWTDANREFLLETRSILGEGTNLTQPGIGRVDGTSAVAGGRGFVFLFNPNYRRMTAHFRLDETIGLGASSAESQPRLLIREVYPVASRLHGHARAGVWRYGERFEIEMDGTSALALELLPAPDAMEDPLLFGADGEAGLRGSSLVLEGVRGEPGTERDLLVLLPEAADITDVTVNGMEMPHRREGAVIHIPARFAGRRFARAQQVGEYDPRFGGGRFTGAFQVPEAVFEQLRQRKEAWPIRWTAEDLKTTWLAPERLLLFVQIAEPDPGMEASLRLDGREVELVKAYSSIRPYERCFVGFYADVSFLEPDREYSAELDLPELRPGQFQGLFFDNVEPRFVDAVEPGGSE